MDAYHSGVVYDERDMRRILATNLKVMWNGSFDAPAYRNPNGIATNTAGTLLPPAGFERCKLKGRATVFDFPLAPCPGLRMAAALPMSFDAASGTLLACDAVQSGEIEIAQYSADGKEKLAVLHQANRGGQMFYRWTGAARGAYRVRFTVNRSTHRQVPVVCS